MYRKIVKRLLDILFSFILIVISSPIQLVLYFLVRTRIGTPVLFAQERIGYHNRTFVMYKFRTMTAERDGDGNLLPDEARLTSFGARLRETSLDELPGLFNIFKGDMSFVGPRPLLPNYVDLYSPRQKRRHNAKPGLTGLAQVNGRNSIEWEEKFEYDLEYADNVSFILDCRILTKTIKKVVKKADINAKDGTAVSAFIGTRKQRYGNRHKETLRILFTHPGNKVEFIRTFLYAAGTLGVQLETYGMDISLGHPAMLICAHTNRCKASKEDGFAEQVLEICKKDRIDLVVPISEDDRILTEYEEAFHKVGTRLLLSSPEVVNMCMDKRRVIDYFVSCGLHTSRPFDNLMDYTGGYPAAIELRDENRGVYSYRVDNEAELQYYIMRFSSYLIRPYIEGTEYEIDVFCDFSGEPIFITPKKREKEQGDEAARYRVVQDDMMILEVKSILEELRPVGPLTIGVIKEEKTGYNYFVGMRPFFSQNASISVKAGADSPLAVIKLMFGSKLTYQKNAADHGVLFSRVEQTVLIKQERGIVHTFRDFQELYDLGPEIEAVIFELDDTLCSKDDFLRGGLRAIASHFPKIQNCYVRMCVALDKGQSPIETVLEEEGMKTPEMVQECWDIVNTHKLSSYELYPGVGDLFRQLRKKKMYIGIITDGVPDMQHNKLQHLNLYELVDEVIVTDDLAGHGNVNEFRKPNDIAYLIMKKRLGLALRNMAFVGGNADLDFEAPGKLGMKCYRYMSAETAVPASSASME